MNSFYEWWNDEKGNEDLKNECENLLRSSSYDHDIISELEKQLWYYSEEELNRLKAILYLNQTNNIDNGLNYTQGDILRKLRHDI